MTPIKVTLNEEQKQVLEGWVRKGKTEKRLADRARIILWSAVGSSRETIAAQIRVIPAVVTKWRKRFLQDGIEGLCDRARSGKPAQYDEGTQERILAVLDKDPPKGFVRWNGPLMAKELGDVSVHQVWRVLREKGISLERRHSWCVSTDPEFAAKAADIRCSNCCLRFIPGIVRRGKEEGYRL